MFELNLNVVNLCQHLPRLLAKIFFIFVSQILQVDLHPVAVRVANSYSAIENPALLRAVTWETSHLLCLNNKSSGSKNRERKQTVLNINN